MKSILKKLIPKKFILFYHFLIASLAALVYRYPSKKMYIIGVTGTKGKTTTTNFIWSTLSAAGNKVGLIGTANIRIGKKESLNKYHMTMPGRFNLQRILNQMLKAGCTYVVLEVTSEGIQQFRHKGIFFDALIFTNLTPEHLEAHGGSFEEYKKTKGRVFAELNKYKKSLNGKKVDKIIIANADSAHADYFLSFPADKKITYSIDKKSDLSAIGIKNTQDGVFFKIISEKQPIQYQINILGEFNVYNALPAIALAQKLGIPKDKVQKGLKELTVIPGRMEKIEEGQDFMVLIDYAHEKESMNRLLSFARDIKQASTNIILLLGAEGGGRDKAKRPAMGEAAGKYADYIIVCNVDPYNDDPEVIIEDIAKAAREAGKIENKNLFKISDRRAGIAKAFELAKKDDIILITGKGSEQSITIGGKRMPWDDRKVVREELKKL